MQKKIFHLRLCFWLGALLDGLSLLPMLFPSIARSVFGMEKLNPDPAYNYAMGIGAALMAGWTVLLIWADRSPMERRGILLITLLPVLAGIVLAGLHAVGQGLIRADRMIPMWITQAILILLFTGTYIHTRPERM